MQLIENWQNTTKRLKKSLGDTDTNEQRRNNL